MDKINSSKDGMIARLNAANDMISDIARCGRRFFAHEDRIGGFEIVKNTVLWRDEYSKKLVPVLASKDNAGFTHGSTLRNFVASLREWIKTGEPRITMISVKNWAYPQEDVERIREYGSEIGFMPSQEELLARRDIRRSCDPSRPQGSSFRLGKDEDEWTAIMDWPTVHGRDACVVVWGPLPVKSTLESRIKEMSQFPERSPRSTEDWKVLNEFLSTENPSRPANSSLHVVQSQEDKWSVVLNWTNESGITRNDVVDDAIDSYQVAVANAHEFELVEYSQPESIFGMGH